MACPEVVHPGDIGQRKLTSLSGTWLQAYWCSSLWEELLSLLGPESAMGNLTQPYSLVTAFPLDQVGLTSVPSACGTELGHRERLAINIKGSAHCCF